MDQNLFKFDLIAEDPTTHARAGVLHTPHGDIETPIFMPVGTKANVKGIPTETVKKLGAQIVLANTYHLSMRPGEDTIAELGGLHKFMNWHGPILTDSGGFQVFSHNDAVKLTDEGVRFIVNDYDGRHVFWTPEDNMEIAMKLGSDICMQLDQCPGYPATRAYVERAVELSSMWAERCYKAHTRDDQALFGIVQGGMHLDLRLRSLRHLEECGDFPGYGIGGYSVGEDHETMFETLAPLVSEYMPKHKPRYLMGVGNPTTLVRGVGVASTCSTVCCRRAPAVWARHSPARVASTSATLALRTTTVPSIPPAPARCARAVTAVRSSVTWSRRRRCSAAFCFRCTTSTTCSTLCSGPARPLSRAATARS